MKKVAENLRISYRQFQRDLANLLGITPTEFQRILRYQNTVRQLYHGRYSEIAQRMGNFNQAHMTKDVKKFTDKTPKQMENVKEIQGSINNQGMIYIQNRTENQDIMIPFHEHMAKIEGNE